MSTMTRQVPTLDDSTAMQRVAALFTDGAYEEAQCCEALGINAVWEVRDLNARPVVPRTRTEWLAHLFLACQPSPRTVAARWCDATTLDALAQAGLVVVDGGSVCPCVAIFPYRGRLIVTDVLGRRIADDQVMPLSYESYWLADAMARAPIFRMLDVCAGSGLHGVFGSRFAEQVVGIDNNPRAVAFARLSCALNGIDNAEFREGNLLADLPARGRFDLIVAQPPFAPEADSVAGANYWSGGPSGEEVLEALVGQLDAHLTPGGRAQIVSLLIYRRNESYERKLRRWLGRYGRHYDIVVRHRPCRLHEIGIERARFDPGWAARTQLWAAQGIVRFELGVVDLIKRQGGRGRFVRMPAQT